ncbi:MAG TPA: prolyl oligopeptidase family serine peptidase [Longimicrobium sp.]|jgi:dienelactone hydrolase
MKPAIALLALSVAACGGSPSDTTPPPIGPITADSCAVARPDFGGPATEADRSLFAYDATAPLNLSKTVESTTGGVETSTISYSSPDGGSVPGILVAPVGRPGSRPGMVILHPSGVPAKGMTPYAQQLAQHGAVVIAIDAPYFRRGGAHLQFTSRDRAEQIQLIKDLQRAVDVLLARGDVDPARIGFEGYSYGGIIGAQFVGVERRLKAAVLAAAHGGQVTGATTAANATFLANQLSCATRNAWFRNMAPIEPIRFIPNASPTALLFQIGRNDTAVLPADAQALYAAASNPKELILYDTGHGLNAQALVDRHNWLHQQLGIDPRVAP